MLVAGHGVRGLGRVKPYNPDSPALASCEAVWLQRRRDDRPTRFTVRHRQPHKRMFLLGFEGIDDLTTLEAWLPSEVSIEMSTVPRRDDELYHFEAIGLEVRTTDDAVVGTVTEVMPLPGNDVWVIAAQDDPKREILVPVVDAIVHEIDLRSRTAVIDPPAGLLEDED